MLNETLDWKDVPDEVKSAFLGRAATRRSFLLGTQFFKFTGNPLIGPSGVISPWWSSVEPVDNGDGGLIGLLRNASALGSAPADFARARSAVTYQWNSMSGLLVASLIQSVSGFVGRCSAQRMNDLDDKVVWIGGAWQVYIPNLTSAHMAQVPRVTPGAPAPSGAGQ